MFKIEDNEKLSNIMLCDNSIFILKTMMSIH